MKKLVTPALGTARYFAGRVMTGGHHYALVSEKDNFVHRQIILGDVSVLEAEGKAVLLPDSADSVVLQEIVEDHIKAQPWVPTEKPYVEFLADAYIFAAQAYSSELNGESEEERESAAAKTAAAEKAAAAKAAAAKAAAAEKAEKAAAAKVEKAK